MIPKWLGEGGAGWMIESYVLSHRRVYFSPPVLVELGQSRSHEKGTILQDIRDGNIARQQLFVRDAFGEQVK